MTLVEVAAAVIENAQGQVLLQQRAEGTHQGGLWEFPGGKREANETLEQTLVREIHEELGIDVANSRRLIRVRHDYGDRQVMLEVYRVTAWSGTVQARENQPLDWVSPGQLASYPMPAADRPIVTALQLPDSFVITPSSIDAVDAFVARFQQLLEQGEKLFLYRVKQLADISHDELIGQLSTACAAHGAQLMLHEQHAEDIAACVIARHCLGLHLSERGLAESAGLHPAPGRLLSVSCHSLSALQRAQALGADFALLSPVEPTASHPGEPALGWERFADLVEQVNLPVFALGGMTPGHMTQAWLNGAQGVAGISNWWQG